MQQEQAPPPFLMKTTTCSQLEVTAQLCSALLCSALLSWSFSAEMLFEAFLCFLVLSLVRALEDQREIKVKPGQDVPLQCRGPRDASVKLLEWSRTDLKEDGYVFFYRNNRLYENYQLPSFRGRVELRDPEMKDGDFSVILKNVNINDTGTYECRIIINTQRNEMRIKPLIRLTVTDSDHTAGNIRDGYRGVVIGLSVIGVLLVFIGIVVMICIKRKGLKEHNSYQLPAEKAGDHLQV